MQIEKNKLIALLRTKRKDYNGFKNPNIIAYQETVKDKILSIRMEGICGWYSIRYGDGHIAGTRHATSAAKWFDEISWQLDRGVEFKMTYDDEGDL